MHDRKENKNNLPPKQFLELLRKRGLTEEKDIQGFLFPSLSQLRPPGSMKNLPQAAALAYNYLVENLQIVVWGDYDVDGTTGTSLLLNFLKNFTSDVIYHIPNRLSEGYGLNAEWFEENISRFKSKHFLLITVDCGISNKEEISAVQRLGGDVIVTDHHAIPSAGVPQCLVLNPEQPDCGFHDAKLAGVAVAFYLVAGIKNEIEKNGISTNIQWPEGVNLKQFLAFVAIGTIADMVELTSINRLLVKAGFEAMADSPFRGLSMLLESCELLGQALCSDDIGYLLGPKINAAGRLGESRIVVDLFTSDSPSGIKSNINKLNRLNEERKELCGDNLDMALATIDVHRVRENKCCIVFGDYHLGTAGIVASRLVEQFGVPAIVLAKVDDAGTYVYKGSGRSVDGVNLVEVLDNCSSLLLKYGGHTMAVGLSCAGTEIEYCVKILEAEISRRVAERCIKKSHRFDIECNVDEVMDKGMLHYLNLMEPYGPGNKQPVFKDQRAKIVNSKIVGKDASHLSVTLRGVYSNYKGIGFNLGSRLSDLQGAPDCAMLYTPTKNRFRGTVSWQVRILDI